MSESLAFPRPGGGDDGKIVLSGDLSRASHQICVDQLSAPAENAIGYQMKQDVLHLPLLVHAIHGARGQVLRPAANIHLQTMDVNKEARAQQKVQRPICLWLTGLSASGKSTLANLVEKHMFAMGFHTYTLDGDNVRHGLNRDLGFSEADRVENIRRVAEVAKLLVDAGLVVIVALISPFRADREMVRVRFDAKEFLEIFVDAPIEECERRDPKGLYAKVRRGELENFTGIDSPYEPPLAPEIRLDTENHSAEECANQVLRAVESKIFREMISGGAVT